MATLREWVSRLWGTLRGNRPDRDLEEELRLHLELATDDARRRGGSPENAARAARIRSGGTAQAMEALRDQRGLPWLQDLASDVRYGCRMLAASPGFTIIAVLSLAIGIGANCAIFSFADALLLRPLPVARPGEVFTVGSTASLEALGASSLVSSYRDYVDIRDRSKSFDGLAAFTNLTAGFATDPKASPKLKMGMLVSGNLFPLMGVEPTIGRAFRPEEDQVPGRDAVVVLGRTMWEQEFGSDPAVLGRSVRINGDEFTVIGVAPPEFTGMDQFVRSDFFVPLMMSPRLISDPKDRSLEARDARNLRLKGRLKAGVSQAEAQTELTAIAADLERAYPDTNKNRRLAVRTELQARIAQSPPDAMLIAMLSTLALAVLFVACANVAGLLTSRAPARAREMALRLAIGAGRGRLVRQLVTESLLIAARGRRAGSRRRLRRHDAVPADSRSRPICPISLAFQMDRRALLFSLIVAVASAVLFGLVPAIQATRTDLTAVMKASDSVAPGRRRRWGRAVLVGGQVAVSVVLLVVAMFMYRGFGQQLANGPGLSHRPSAHDELRSEPGALHRSAVAAVLRAGRRARARRAGRQDRHDDHVGSDVERFDRLRDGRAGRISVPGREGQRHGSGVERGRTLLRHDGAHDSPGTQLPRRGFRRRAARRHREPAVRPALLAESGSDRQALSTGRQRQDRGSRSSGSRRPANTSSSPSRRRSSSTFRIGRRSRNG